MKKALIFWLIAISSAFSAEKYEVYSQKALLDASLDSAISQVGVCEKTNNNDGLEVQKYQRLLNLKEGAPYCAAGVYWCFITAARALNLPDSAIPIVKSPLANGIYNGAMRRGTKVNYLPQKHDLIVWRKISGSSGHIERICEVLQGGWVRTIGFNSSIRDSCGKKIEGVFYQRRNIKHPLGRLLIRGLIGFRTA